MGKMLMIMMMLIDDGDEDGIPSECVRMLMMMLMTISDDGDDDVVDDVVDDFVWKPNQQTK
eukprot:2055373-Amphidinium_carterae.1